MPVYAPEGLNGASPPSRLPGQHRAL